MDPISAPDAISPALRRTRAFLFQPFRLGTFLKLCLVALLTEGFGSNFHSSWSGSHSTHRVTTMTHVTNVSWTPTAAAWNPNTFPGVNPAWVVAMIAAGLVAMVVGFVIFYLITRLRFAYFHCLVHNIREIRPGWRRYGGQAARFFWMNVVVGLCFIAAAAVVVLCFAGGIWNQVRESGGHPALGPMLALILPGIVVIFALVVVAIAADLILRDFLLPHYALENASFGQAWSESWHRFRLEPGAFVGYALLRIFLPLVAWVGIVLILILPTILTVAAVALIEMGIHAASAHAGGAIPAEGIVLQVAIGAVTLALTFLVWLAAGGPLNTAVREYALVFYGGRYQPLGDALAAPQEAAAGI